MVEISTHVGKVRVDSVGAGPPVVLLHATLHDRHDYDPIIAGLAGRFTAIAVDWPGHGDSAALPDGVRAGGPLFARVLEEVLAELDLPSAAFIGNSVGGFAAAHLAITQPERVRALVLVNSAGFTPQTLLTRSFCRLLGSPAIARRVLPRMVPTYMKARTDSDRTIVSRALARCRTDEGIELAAALWRSFAAPAYDLRPQAAKITVPTLLPWGSKDTVLPLRAGRATHAAIAGSALIPFDTGHVVFSSDPEGFLAEVLPFLEKAFAAG
jgi:pimeloyl-ACP methyl ester carboxylesterase